MKKTKISKSCTTLSKSPPELSGYVDCDGALIYFKCIGSGKPLLILNGGPGLSHEYIVEPLLPLAQFRQLVFIDQRGCGRSKNNIARESYTLAQLVRDVEHVRQALDFEVVDLLGHSFGGILAQMYAISYSQYVGAMLLIATSSCAADINSDFIRIRERAPVEVRLRLDQLEAKGIYRVDGAQVPAYTNLVNELLRPYMYARMPPPINDEENVPCWDALRILWGDKSDLIITGKLCDFDLTAELRWLRIPTLILYGDQDIVSDRTAHTTHVAITGSIMQRIAGAGHELHTEQPEQFIQAVQAFLGAM